MKVQGEWMWFTWMRLALARALVWFAWSTALGVSKVLLCRHHPYRVWVEGTKATSMKATMESLRHPNGARLPWRRTFSRGVWLVTVALAALAVGTFIPPETLGVFD